MRRPILGILMTAVAVSLTLTASAFARAGDRTFADTYPVASALCVKAHAGTLGSKLEPNAAAVITACDTLENAFPPLVSTVDGAEATELSTLSAQNAAVATACPKPVTDPAACRGARETRRSTDAAARLTLVGAVGAFHASVEANRVTFWTTVSTLR